MTSLNNAGIMEIPRRSALNIVKQKHYLHRSCSCIHAFGLIVESEILGVVIFGVPASRHMMKGACPDDPDSVLELNRLWLHDCLPKNSESWFLARALKLMPPRIILSYADTGVGHVGFVYRASNFFFAGHTDMDRKTPRFDVVPATPSVDMLGMIPEKHSRDTSRQHGEKIRRPRSTKNRYWTVTGDRRDRRRLIKKCQWPRLRWKPDHTETVETRTVTT